MIPFGLVLFLLSLFPHKLFKTKEEEQTHYYKQSKQIVLYTWAKTLCWPAEDIPRSFTKKVAGPLILVVYIYAISYHEVEVYQWFCVSLIYD